MTGLGYRLGDTINDEGGHWLCRVRHKDSWLCLDDDKRQIYEPIAPGKTLSFIAACAGFAVRTLP